MRVSANKNRAIGGSGNLGRQTSVANFFYDTHDIHLLMDEAY